MDYQSRTQVASDGRRWLLDGDPGPRAAFCFFAQITFARIQMFEIDVGTEVGTLFLGSHSFSTCILDICLEEF